MILQLPHNLLRDLNIPYREGNNEVLNTLDEDNSFLAHHLLIIGNLGVIQFLKDIRLNEDTRFDGNLLEIHLFGLEDNFGHSSIIY